MPTYAHRGLHTTARGENTIYAFHQAMQRMDGFECDVRLSKDNVPMIIHDRSLYRTHRRRKLVASTSSADLEAMGIPPLRRVLQLLQGNSATAILDLKVKPVALMHQTRRLCRQLRVPLHQVIFLVWEDVAASSIPSGSRVYRARNFQFNVHGSDAYEGVACKYSGSAVNRQSINRALSAGFSVNLYPSGRKHVRAARDYQEVCSFTI